MSIMLVPQVDILRPKLLGEDKDAFAFRYCDRHLVPSYSRGGRQQPGNTMKRWDSSGGSRLYELHGLLTQEVMIRRLKKDVLGELPPKRRQVIRLPRPAADRWPVAVKAASTGGRGSQAARTGEEDGAEEEDSDGEDEGVDREREAGDESAGIDSPHSLDGMLLFPASSSAC